MGEKFLPLNIKVNTMDMEMRVHLDALSIWIMDAFIDTKKDIRGKVYIFRDDGYIPGNVTQHSLITPHIGEVTQYGNGGLETKIPELLTETNPAAFMIGRSAVHVTEFLRKSGKFKHLSGPLNTYTFSQNNREYPAFMFLQ